VVIAFEGPGDFDGSVAVGADEKARGVGLGGGGALAGRAGVAEIAAFPQGVDRDQGAGIGRALAAVDVAERHGVGREIAQRRNGQKQRAGHVPAIVAIAMANTRLEILKSMVEQKPADSFSRYGLAMEYANSGDLEAAVTEFRALLEHNPNYAAGYFHGGQTLEKLGRIEDAREIYRKGIEVTGATGDEHTRSELIAALRNLA